jgi:transposase
VVAAKGLGRVRELITLLAEAHDDRVPPLAREVLMAVVAQLRDVEQKIAELERQLLAWHRTNEVSQRPGSRPARGQRKGRTGLALEPEATEDLLELARAIEHLMAYRSDRDRLKPVQFRAQRSA